MSTRVQWRRGNTAQTAAFTGASGEITVDTDKNVVVVHDGVTQGGSPAPTLTFVQHSYDQANSAYAAANNVAPQIQPTFNQANAAFDRANASYAAANNVFPQIQPAFNQANAAYTYVTTVDNYAQSGYAKANSANVLAQAAYNNANTKFASAGGTISGSVTITGQANVNSRLAVGTGNYTVLPNLIAQFTGTSDYYSQINQQNLSGNGSGDIVVTADNGTDQINFIDMGIAGSTYNDSTPNAYPTTRPNDGYLYMVGNPGSSVGGNLVIGTAGSGSFADITIVQGTSYTETARFKYGQGLVIETNTASTSNTTGALVVQGGVGVSGNVYAGAVYDSGVRLTTTISTANSSLKSYVDNANTSMKSYVDNANTSLKSYTDTAISTANTSMKSYVDNANTSMKSYVDTTVSTANTSLKSYVDSANTTIQGQITYIQGVDNSQNTTISNLTSFAQAAFNSANNVAPQIQPAFNTANAAYTKANSAGVFANGAYTVANASYTQANTGTVLAQGAFDTANSKLSLSGGTVTGAVTIHGDLTATGNVSFTGNVTSIAVTGNTGQFFGYTSNGFNALYAGIPVGFTVEPDTVFQTTTNVNGFAQSNQQNINSGNQSTTDYVATSNAGNNTTYYVDLGIAGSGYNGTNANNSLGTSLMPNDAYLYSQGNAGSAGGNLVIGTSITGTVTKVIAGGVNDSDVVTLFTDTQVYVNRGLTLTAPITFADASTQNTAASPIAYSQASYAQANAAFSSGNTTLTYAQAGFSKANAANVLAQASFDTGNTTLTYAQAAFTSGNSTLSYAQAGFLKANGAVQTGFTTISANGATITPSSNADTFTITAAKANGINVLNPSSKTIDFGLVTSGVTAGTYGGSTNIPVIVTDGFGRITSASNVAVSTTINLAGTSGTGSVAGGGTLTFTGTTGITTSASGSTITINNTGVTSLSSNSSARITQSSTSGAVSFDLATTGVSAGTYSYPSIQVDSYGRTVAISNQTPVTSFNTRTGAVTLSSSDVTTALTYTPANKAGDTFTGPVVATTLTTNTSVSLSTAAFVVSNTFTTSSTSQVSVDSFAVATYRSAKYEVQMTSGSSYHVIELRVMHDGTTVWLDQYGEMFTSSSLGTFDATITTGILNLLFTATNAITTVKLLRNTLTV